MKNTTSQNGFTLIELVIIMVILGVLAAVAVPRLGSTIDSSEASAEEAVIANLRSALEVYAMDKVVESSSKSYPNNPFDALDDKSKNELLSGNWSFEPSVIHHTRNDGTVKSWMYESWPTINGGFENPSYGVIMDLETWLAQFE